MILAFNYIARFNQIPNNVILLFSNEGVPLEEEMIFKYSGDFEILDNIVVDVGISDVSADVFYIPESFILHSAYPNPFNPITHIDFDIPSDDNIQLVIYDISGRKVDALYQGSINAGYHQLTWYADKFSSGVYFVVLTSSTGYKSTQKVMLLK